MNGGDSGTNTGPKIGRTLELARKERGLTLEQVEEATKIRTGYLRALERENFDVLPAVYVQGSLKTYASFLHLDADAMVQEFKRRQAPQEKPPYPLYVGPLQEDDTLDDILAAAGRKAKSQTETEEDRSEGAAPSLLPAGVSWYLYLGSAVFLVLVVAAAALALNAARDSRTEVSHVREPLISRAPETAPPGAADETRVQNPAQGNKRQGADEGKDKPRPHHSADSAAKNEASSPAPQNSASATATATAAAEPENEKASVEPEKATVHPEKTPAEPPRSSQPSTQASEPTRQVGTAPPPSSPSPTGQPQSSPSSPSPTGQPQSSPSSPSPTRQGGGGQQTRVKVVVGGKDPVQLSGGPFDD
jgi:cytoskeletal protein RodZ